MKIIHHIFSTWNAEQADFLQGHKINVNIGAQSFTLDEDELYLHLKPYLDSWGVADARLAAFSKEDYDTAQFFTWYPSWQHQYPQPEKNFGYLSSTYDDANLCKECGIGAEQVDPFQDSFIPPFTEGSPGMHLFKSKDYFGSGASARKYVFISAELRKELIGQKVNAEYIPAASN